MLLYWQIQHSKRTNSPPSPVIFRFNAIPIGLLENIRKRCQDKGSSSFSYLVRMTRKFMFEGRNLFIYDDELMAKDLLK